MFDLPSRQASSLVYAAMDWLLPRQKSIERKLAKRHPTEGPLALYDVSSSYYTGRTCSLARPGHDRDGKKGYPIIVYGLLADAQGRPVAVEVYLGNTGDPTTVYLQWRPKRAWAPLLFEEEDLENDRRGRDPEAAAAACLETKRTGDGESARFATAEAMRVARDNALGSCKKQVSHETIGPHSIV